MIIKSVPVSKTMSPVKTRGEVAEGFDHTQAFACDLICAATARTRHLARVDEAALNATRWLMETDGENPWAPSDGSEPHPQSLVFLSILDAVGIGGELGTGRGGATTRHPAFQKCGSGRKQAGDGGAWTAAINELACLDYPDRNGGTELHLRAGMSADKDPTIFMVDDWGKEVDVGPAWVDDPSRAWLLALARRAVLARHPETTERWSDLIYPDGADPFTGGWIARIQGKWEDWATLLEWLERFEDIEPGGVECRRRAERDLP